MCRVMCGPVQTVLASTGATCAQKGTQSMYKDAERTAAGVLES